MLHRRFARWSAPRILLEHHAGKPLGFAPVHAVMNISEKQGNYAVEAAEFLRNQGLRAEIDLRNEKVGYKIRDHTLKRVPYLLVAGDREVESRSLAVRTRSGKDLGAMPWKRGRSIAQDVASRGLRHLED
jgi:threonyl-tRNA synthetase